MFRDTECDPVSSDETSPPWWPSWLGRGALINVDAPGCGTSLVRGTTGHK